MVGGTGGLLVAWQALVPAGLLRCVSAVAADTANALGLACMMQRIGVVGGCAYCDQVAGVHDCREPVTEVDANGAQ